MYVGLYQSHLSTRPEFRVIAFNKPRGIIQFGPNAVVFDEYLDDEDKVSGRPWFLYYAGLSVDSVVLVLLVALLTPLTPLPVLSAGVFLAVASFWVCSIAPICAHREASESGDGGGTPRWIPD